MTYKFLSLLGLFSILTSVCLGQYTQQDVYSGTFNFFPYCNPVVSPDGRWAFVSNTNRDEIIKLDLLSFTTQTLHAGTHPATLSLSPDGQTLAAVNYGTIQFSGDTVSLFDVTSDDDDAFAEFDPDANFGYYNNVVFTQDNMYAFVASRYNGYLYAFDPWSGDLIQDDYVGMQPTRITISPDGKLLAVVYVQNSFMRVKLLDLETFYRNGTFHYDQDIDVQSVRQDTTNVVFTPDSRKLLAPSYNMSKIQVFNVSNGTLDRQVNVDAGPIAIHIDPELDRLYSVNVTSNSISIVNLTNWQVANHTFSGSNFDITNNVMTLAGAETAIVCSKFNSQLIMFDAINGNQLDSFTIGNGPNGISADLGGNRIVTVSEHANRLDILTMNRTICLNKVDIDDSKNLGFAFLNTEPYFTSSMLLSTFPDEGGVATTQRDITLPSRSQYVREWTSPDLTLPVPFSGWMSGNTALMPVKGFAMFYQRDMEWLDGYSYTTVPRFYLVIPYVDIREGSICRLHLVNPNYVNLTITLKLYHNDGSSSWKYAQVPGRGRVVLDDLQEFFQKNGPEEGFVVLDALSPFNAMVEFGSTVSRAALPAIPLYLNTGNQVALPHYADGGGWRTRVVLSNIDFSSARLEGYLYDEIGNQIASKIINIFSNKQIVKEVWDLFDIVQPQDLRSGWIKFSGEISKIRAAVIFETSDGLLFTALAGQLTPKKELFFSHVAQDDTYFTGIALVNDSDGSTNADVEIFDQLGNSIRFHQIPSLGQREKFVRLLSQDPFLLNQQLGGYIQIKSKRPLFGYALFGINEKFLSAIPSQ